MIKIGLTKEMYSIPLLSLLEKSSDINAYLTQSTSENNQQLVNGTFDAAQISIIDYAENSSELALIREFAISSTGESGYALIFFQKNLEDFESIVYQAADQYLALTQIVMREFFEIDPRWELVSTNQELEKLLKKYQGILLSGNEALRHHSKEGNDIDVTEEWWSQKESPYIHSVLAVRKNSDKIGNVKSVFQLINSKFEVDMEVMKIHLNKNDKISDKSFELIRNPYSFLGNDQIWESALEYLKFLYYYEKIPYIPGLNFL